MVKKITIAILILIANQVVADVKRFVDEKVHKIRVVNGEW